MELAQYKPYGYASNAPMLTIINQFDFPESILADESVFTIYPTDAVEGDEIDTTILVTFLLSASVDEIKNFAAEMAGNQGMKPPTGFRAVIVPNKEGIPVAMAYELAYYDVGTPRNIHNGPFDSRASYFTVLAGKGRGRKGKALVYTIGGLV